MYTQLRIWLMKTFKRRYKRKTFITSLLIETKSETNICFHCIRIIILNIYEAMIFFVFIYQEILVVKDTFLVNFIRAQCCYLSFFFFV